ncbi:DUF3558 domain-containing protein [Streptomyces sp. S3(2020)]|uniref:DUF3558 domain-containing protein n=1 Tax=Streptomyces sp. S3(2020) TaxID=2732044 RepID=UPI001488AAE2|nr:DUF3558 domain-containing protein [Streptomyces sp. S3(2020)]NNN36437.1 DUF3558 domain-containing protein [Streptomyces sp. S3(2020)]
MQRAAQRDQGGRRAKRLSHVLLGAAAVPVMLVAAGCSSDSGSDDAGGDKSSETSASVSASPTVQAATYTSLPDACDTLSKGTLGDLVPKASKSGKQGKSDDIKTRGSCSWSSLDNNGVKGSQFRWLNVSLLRFDSDVTRGEGDKLAQEYFDKQVQDAQAVDGAKNAKAAPVTGTGEAATLVTYDLKKKEGSFKQQTLVTRVENVVVTVDYNGAGLAGEKTPSADTLAKLVKTAAKEAVASVTKANSGGGTGTGGAASPSPSKSASKSPSTSTSKSTSPSKSTAKKS